MTPTNPMNPPMINGASAGWLPPLPQVVRELSPATAASRAHPPQLPAAPSGGFSPLRHQDRSSSRLFWEEPRCVAEREFVEVVLRKELIDGQSAKFGFANIPSPDGRHLLVTWVDANGLLGMWNRASPDRAVREGDAIVAVNGVRDDVEAMRSQLQQGTAHMLVRRGHSSGAIGLVS